MGKNAHLFGHRKIKIKYCELASDVNGGVHLSGVTRHVIFDNHTSVCGLRGPLFLHLRRTGSLGGRPDGQGETELGVK